MQKNSMVIDLTKATNCIRVMKEYGTYNDHKIGIMKEDVPTLTSMVSGFREGLKGKLVLYREEYSSDDGPRRELGTVTVETPLSQEEIDKQKAKHSLITTMGTIVGVPKSYVEEVRI